jgi:CO/xanthine dehydrogenase Mo-binding subunit
MVATVAAESDDMARQSRELIQLEYELLPVLIDPHQALRPDAPQSLAISY